MSVASMLENMKRRALDSTYDAYISEEYDACTKPKEWR